MESKVLTVRKAGFRWLHVEKETGLTYARKGTRPGTAYFFDGDGQEWFGFLGCDAETRGHRKLMVAPNIWL